MTRKMPKTGEMHKKTSPYGRGRCEAPGEGSAPRPRLRTTAAALLLLFSLAFPAFAVEPSERLADPALEARARAISAVLRCLVCQNESIDDSHADLAHDIRMLVRQRLTAGDSDQAAIQAVVDRYGDFVLLKPPVEPATYVLWFGPVGLLLVGLAGTLVWLRRRNVSTEAVAPLTEAERQRLDGLLREGP
jgi:cytochrome c-type biogenesis protein CcmH